MIATQAEHRHPDFLIAAVALALLLAWDLSGLDLAVTRLVAGATGFAWRDPWVTRVLLHEGGRVLAWLLLGLLVVNVWRPFIDGPTRAERLRWLLVTLACVIAVPALKRVSATSCPWDLAEFGGMAAYVSHWRFGFGDGGPGHCFPSGHAVSAFAFLSGWFELRRHRPRLARRWLAAVLALGVLYGGTQFVRGAHYLSHTLWTAWFCWSLCAVVYASARRAEPLAQAAGA
jgi:membrane-associated PAP2 superfamily phosphatase